MEHYAAMRIQTAITHNLDESPKRKVEQKKLDTKKNILYRSIHIENKNWWKLIHGVSPKSD